MATLGAVTATGSLVTIHHDSSSFNDEQFSVNQGIRDFRVR